MINTQIYSAVTEKIIANLQQAGSWKKLWQIPSPVSLNGHYYQGVNTLILSSDQYKSRVYGTFQQIRANGGMVRKGEKSTWVVFTKTSTKEDERTLETKKTFLLRYFHVFNTEQADFDDLGKVKIARLQGELQDRHNQAHVEAERIIAGYQNAPDIQYSESDDRAYYSPLADLISVPKMRYFESSSEFYHALYHEMAHSTGHPKRLGRFDFMSNQFGSEPYSKEELVAELCSSFLSEIASLELNIRNSAAYICGWSSKLRDNQKWILWAAARAEKAADYILGRHQVQGAEEESATTMVQESGLYYPAVGHDFIEDDEDYADSTLFPGDLDVDGMGNCYSDADPGL